MKNPSNVHAVYLLVIKQYFVAKTFPLIHRFVSVRAVAWISQVAGGEWNCQEILLVWFFISFLWK